MSRFEVALWVLTTLTRPSYRSHAVLPLCTSHGESSLGQGAALISLLDNCGPTIKPSLSLVVPKQPCHLYIYTSGKPAILNNPMLPNLQHQNGSYLNVEASLAPAQRQQSHPACSVWTNCVVKPDQPNVQTLKARQTVLLPVQFPVTAKSVSSMGSVTSRTTSSCLPSDEIIGPNFLKPTSIDGHLRGAA